MPQYPRAMDGTILKKSVLRSQRNCGTQTDLMLKARLLCNIPFIYVVEY
jgi:hypothetical protein